MDTAAPDKPALDAIHIISDVETLRVVADRTRLEMLEFLRTTPHTVKEIAAELGVPANKLYYHVRLLEEHGLISVVDTRVVSGIIEKSYQTTAYRFTVDRALLPGAHDDDSALAVLLSVILDEAASEIRRSVERGLIDLSIEGPEHGGIVLGRSWKRMTRGQAQLFADRIYAALKESALLANGDDDDGAQTYEILVGIYPTVRGPHLIDNDDGGPPAPDDG